MSDVPSQGNAMRQVPSGALFLAGSGREDHLPDEAEAKPAAPREAACPTCPPGREDQAASSLPRLSSCRRLPTGLY